MKAFVEILNNLKGSKNEFNPKVACTLTEAINATGLARRDFKAENNGNYTSRGTKLPKEAALRLSKTTLN